MTAAERKRPFYLVLALLGALALGVHGASGGWERVRQYRETVEVTQIARGIADEGDRAAFVSRFQAFVAVLDSVKNRGWPIAVGSLILGTAVMVFAMRALGGNRGARAVLMQLVVAQAGLDAANHWLLRDLLKAELALDRAAFFAQSHEAFSDRRRAEDVASAHALWSRVAVPVFFGLRMLGSALIVVALVQRRSRDLLDASTAPIEER
jgi:hypothetical protein